MDQEVYETLYKKLNSVVSEYNFLITLFDKGIKSLESNIISGEKVDNGVLEKCKTKCNSAVNELKVLINTCSTEINLNIDGKQGEENEQQ